jgi:signal transduction histidine kinase
MLKSYFSENLRKDWLLHFSGLLTWSIIAFLSLQNKPFGLEFMLKSIAFIAFLLLDLLLISSKQSMHIIRNRFFLFLQTALVLGLIYYDKYSLVAILLVLIATQLPSMFARKQAMIIMLTISLAHLAIEYDGDFLNSFFRVLIYFMLQVFGFSAIESVHRESKAKEDMAEINQELLATRFMLKESSQRKERLRISRDLHDVIGHQLTALSLNLEVSCHKVPTEFKPMLRDNLQQAKNLLSDVREVVKEMRKEEQFDLIATLNGLIEQLPNCQLEVTNQPSIKSLSLKQQLVFCLQEGISNAIRHGKADKITLNFETIDDKLQVTLQDNGNVEADIVLGNGLTGMQERLAEFKGKVDFISTANGGKLTIQVEDLYD